MILVIDQTVHRASIYADMLHYMGVIAKPESYKSALGEVSLRYRAIIIVNPECLPDAEDYLRHLCTYAHRTPIFAISKNPRDIPVPDAFAISFDDAIYSSTLLSRIADYCKQNALPVPGTYALAGIDASVDRGYVTFFDTPLSLTRTESMILRYLISVYPASAQIDEILAFAYRDSRRPEQSSVRAHICIINKKFRKIRGRSLISHKSGIGYSVITPIDILSAKSV